jgi:hypothetical protein
MLKINRSKLEVGIGERRWRRQLLQLTQHALIEFLTKVASTTTSDIEWTVGKRVNYDLCCFTSANWRSRNISPMTSMHLSNFIMWISSEGQPVTHDTRHKTQDTQHNTTHTSSVCPLGCTCDVLRSRHREH